MAERSRNVRRFALRERGERKNSQSVRRLLFDLISQEFGKSSTKAANSLSATLKSRRPRDRRAFRRGFSGESLYKVAIDRQTISFTQLDAIALHYKVPLALVLLFTRLRSEVELADSHHTGEAMRILNALRAAIQELEKLLLEGPGERDVYEHLNHRAFEETVGAYLDAFDALMI